MGGCPLLNFGTEADDTNPELRNRVAKAVKRSQQRITGLIEGGQANGEFTKTIDAATFGLKMFTMIQGGMFASRVTNNKNLMKTVIDILKKEIDEL